MRLRTLAIVPTYIAHEQAAILTSQALAGLAKQDCQILVVDDLSPRQDLLKEVEAVASSHGVQFHKKQENTGFASTVNVGLNQALCNRQDAILVNADIKFHDGDWLMHMQGSDAYVTGAQLMFPTGVLQHCGIYYSVLHRCFDHIYYMAPKDMPEAQVSRVCPVTGALQYIRYESLALVGLYDENFKMGYEDVDYCIRVFQAGRECRYEPKAKATHYESMFRKDQSEKHQQWLEDSWVYLHQKHAGHSFADYMPIMLGEEND